MLKFFLLNIFSLCFCISLVAQSLSEKEFKNPSKQYKPKTWMHAMSANMSKEGLTKDFEAMSEAGLGGLLLFNITQGIPNGKVKYNSPEHHEMLKYAAQEAERLGLSFGVHNCDGWSSSGGPWVKPEESMKMVVWSEQVVKGGQKIRVKMPQPTTCEGFYRDIAVLAYPALSSEITDFEAKPMITSSDKKFNIALATDHLKDQETTIKKVGTEKPWILFDYGKSHTVRSVVMIMTDRNTDTELYISDDGLNFKLAKKLKKVRTGKGEWAINDHFEAITARYFQLRLSDNITIKEVSLLATYQVDNLLARTAIARTEGAEFEAIGNPESLMIVDKNKIIDLSKSMNLEGMLQTDLPEGTWTILRFGYTSTSASNNPASAEGKGLEIDKLNRPAFKKHYDAFVKKVIDNAKPVAPNALQYVEIDSYEMGGQNWTDDFEALFKQEYGYEIRPFLPLIAGRFMDNAKTSEAVLDDFREFICHLMTENYFGYFQELCHKDGLKTYIEPYGFGPINDLDVGAKADLPMGEFWMNRELTQVGSAISAAHIYGKSIISAESFTAGPEINWKGHPAIAKSSGDKAWAVGINEFMFHRFTHQSNPNVLPGMTMNRWGSHFDRTQNWWLNAGAAWFKYLSRGAYLLQSGVPVSDLLVFVGDGSPNGVLSRKDFKPNIPKGTNFDCVNLDVLLNRIKVENGELVLPEGTRYKALVLSNTHKMKLATVKRLQEFAQKGIVIIGEKPQELRGYVHTQNQQTEFVKMVDDIWSKPTTVINTNWSDIYKKFNIQSDFIIEGRNDIDMMHRKIGNTDVYFIHNPDSLSRTFNVQFRVNDKIPELWNPMDGSIRKIANFSEKGNYTETKITLEAEGAGFVVFRESSKNIVSISLEKDKKLPYDIVFNLSKNNVIEAQASKNGIYKTTLSNGKIVDITAKNIPETSIITGAWQVQFKEILGYGGTFQFDNLTDWKDHNNDTIKHYSGTAIYKKSFSISKNMKMSDIKTTLDLGKVCIAAKVILNGKDMGVAWMPPYRLDITDALKDGQNDLEIEVSNLWTNRLIGDERYPANDDHHLDTNGIGNNTTKIMPEWFVQNKPRPNGERKTFTTANFYKATDELVPSGLLGPVQIQFSKIIEVK